MTNAEIVSKLWNLCNVLRDDGITYHQYVTELTYILFLKMAKETETEKNIPEDYRWDVLKTKEGMELNQFYEELLRELGENCSGRVQEIYQGARSNIEEPANLKKIITNIDELDWYSAKEEGLGNLKGSRQIYKDYGSRIREWISFDGVLGECVNRAVGSYRYRVSVNVRGGHSYSDFGRENAIAVLAEIIHDLYQIEPPFGEKTTYNVGTIEGGTTVNSIAQSASMLYEFRSASQECLKEMEERFRAVIRKWQEDGNREAVCRKRASGKNFGKEITVEVLGVRPGNGPVNEKRLEELTRVNVDLIESCISGTVTVRAGSTDANIPLSEGIPANTFGTVRGGLEHTREEWMEIESMREGMLVAMGTLARYCTASGKTIL